MGFTLLYNNNDNLLDLNKGHMQPIIGMVGVWKMERNYKQVVQGWVQMLYQLHTLLWKTSNDELSICCMNFVSLCNRCSTLIVLVNNYIVSSIKLFMISVFESCIE